MPPQALGILVMWSIVEGMLSFTGSYEIDSYDTVVVAARTLAELKRIFEHERERYRFLNTRKVCTRTGVSAYAASLVVHTTGVSDRTNSTIF